MTDFSAFVRANTVLGAAPLVPEFQLHLASEITPIWQATESWLRAENIEPPFWAFAWPGSVALARYVLDHPGEVAGLRVLDFAAGCGLAALAACRAGAGSVEACEIDRLAVVALGLNAEVNGCAVTATLADLVGVASRWDLILCGDVCYEAPMTNHIMPWLHALATAGTQIWLADPGRAYVPTLGLQAFFCCDVPTTRELEDRAARHVVLYRLLPQMVEVA